MTRSRLIAFFAGAAVVGLTALSVTACGSSGSGASASTAPPTTTTGKPATIGVAATDLGKILVDGQGRTLYLFQRDQGTKSACSGACASNWPPLRVSGKPTIGQGVQASMVSTTKRSDGNRQVTYNGHPLYLFVGDHQAGDTSGQGVSAFGGAWYVLSPAGNEITSKPSNSNGSNPAGGSGY
jgi:predicted lipoprotein with Yx(FWY)xxD motif